MKIAVYARIKSHSERNEMCENFDRKQSRYEEKRNDHLEAYYIPKESDDGIIEMALGH